MSDSNLAPETIQSITDAIAKAHPEAGVVAIKASDLAELMKAATSASALRIPEPGNAVLRNWMMQAFHVMTAADRLLSDIAAHDVDSDEDSDGFAKFKSRREEVDSLMSGLCGQLPALLGFVNKRSIPRPDMPVALHQMVLKDRDGTRRVAEIDALFVASVAGTPALSGLTDMTTQDGAYSAPATRVLAFGFGLGVRCADRLKAPASISLSADIAGD